MHNYTIADVEADGFDLTLLKIDQSETDTLVKKVRDRRAVIWAELLEIQNYNSSKYPYIDQARFVADMGLTSANIVLSMIFDNDLLLDISSAVDNQVKQIYPSWCLTNKIYEVLRTNHKLATKAFWSPDVGPSFKQFVVGQQFITCEELLVLVKDGSIIKAPEYLQLKMLELCDAADVGIFFKSDFEKIRLAAYKKAGPITNLDVMIKDHNWTVRLYAISILSAGDKRLASFISDKSLNVFCVALHKIDSGLLPMMFGSYHIKKSRAKEIVKQRLNDGK